MKNVSFKEDEEDPQEYIFIEDRTIAIHTEFVTGK